MTRKSPLPVLGALTLLALPVSAQAQSMLDGLKEKAGSAARAVGDVTGQVVDSVNQTVEETRNDLRDEATPEETRAKLDAMAEATLQHLFESEPGAKQLFDASVGYAVFNTRQVSYVVSGAYGRGVAVERVRRTEGEDKDENAAGTSDATGAASGTPAGPGPGPGPGPGAGAGAGAGNPITINIPAASEGEPRGERRTYMKMGSAGVGLSLGFGGFDTQVVIFFESPFAFHKFVTQGLDATAEAATLAGAQSSSLAMRYESGRAVFVLTKEGWKVSAKLAGTKYWRDEALN